MWTMTVKNRKARLEFPEIHLKKPCPVLLWTDETKIGLQQDDGKQKI